MDGFENAARQLIRAGIQCVMSTAHLKDVPRLQGIFSARFLPLTDTLRLAQLVVCHGGTQTVYQALAAATPVLTLPSHLETALTSVAIVQAGLGCTLPRNSIAHDPNLLTSCVEIILADSALKSRVQDFAMTIDSSASLSAAVEVAEALASEGAA
jgi:UDP:flavonoid glycosyltransferase YjiC (YdhE family)